MATVGNSVEVSRPAQSRKPVAGYPADSRAFDLWSVLLSAWFMAGLFLDGWAHNHIAELETFFTPWHAVLYSGYLAVAALLVFTQYRNVNRGYAWARALPRGYTLSLLGAVIFFAGAGLDMLWHIVFGIEQNTEALFSPSHLLLGSGSILFLAGPLRAVWHRPGGQGWRELWPAVLSLTMLFSFFTFFTQYANIFGAPEVIGGFRPRGDTYFAEVTSVSYVLFPAALMMGSLLLALRRWRLPFGAVTFMFTVNALVMVLMRFDYASDYWLMIIAAGLGGLLADVLIWRLRPSVERVSMLRLFAFVLPFAYFLLLFAAIVLTQERGLWWEIHTWLGVPFIAGIIGLGLTFLLVPPPLPAESTAL